VAFVRTARGKDETAEFHCHLAAKAHFGGEIRLPTGCLKPVQVTDIRKILGDGKVFFGG
jgi:hypothetical protein